MMGLEKYSLYIAIIKILKYIAAFVCASVCVACSQPIGKGKAVRLGFMLGVSRFRRSRLFASRFD